MSGSPTNGPTKPANPFATDAGLRPVRMASGVALTYLQPESASQVLCQALPVQRWQQLLGGGKVGRRAGAATEPSCTIGSSEANVVMTLEPPAQQRFTSATQVARRPATIETDGISTDGTVALTDNYWSDRQGQAARPLLEVSVFGYMNGMPDDKRRAILTKVLDALVPVLAAPGEPVPAVDVHGDMAFRRTPVTVESFLDLPKPTQALQLCTALSELGATPVRAQDSPECSAKASSGDTVHLRLMAQPHEPTAYPARVSGRPAIVDGDRVRVLLRDGIPLELQVSGADDARAFAENLVAELT